MAAKKAAKSLVKQAGKTFVKNDGNNSIILDPAEKQWLLSVLNDPKFAKALDAINQFKPPVFPVDNFGPTVELKKHNTECRIYEIRGWELYHARLLTIANAEKAKTEYPELPEETYGVIDNE